MFIKFQNILMLKKVKRLGYEPCFRSVQKLGNGYYICPLAFRSPGKSGVPKYVVGGMDKNIDKAMVKSISEYVERITFWLAKENGEKSGLHSYLSSGYAAYPRKIFSNSLKRAREYSLRESVEKFCWPEFWHNRNIGYTIEPGCKSWLSEYSQFKIDDYSLIFPDIEDISWVVCISLGRIGDNGVVVGAACARNKAEAREHAFTEMLRKYIALRNVSNGFPADWKEWGERLVHLSRHGFSLYQKRLKSEGRQKLILPPLELDGEIESHPFNSFYHVYRTRFKGKKCYFEGQGNAVGYL